MKLYRIAFATLAVLIASAFFATRADVVVCSDAACSVQSQKPKAAVVSADLVYFCTNCNDTNVGTPKDIKNAIQVIPWGSLQGYSFTLTTGGWYRYQDIPDIVAPPPFVYKPPPCDFSILSLGLYWKWEGAGFYAILYCETLENITPTRRAFALKTPAKTTTAATATVDLVAIDRTLTNRDITASEQVVLDAYEAETRPTAKVVNATLADGTIVGPVWYVRNPDGTKGKQAPGRAPKDADCTTWMLWSRLVTITNDVKAPTNYWRVTGTDYFASCKVTGKYVKLP